MLLWELLLRPLASRVNTQVIQAWVHVPHVRQESTRLVLVNKFAKHATLDFSQMSPALSRVHHAQQDLSVVAMPQVAQLVPWVSFQARLLHHANLVLVVNTNLMLANHLV